MELTREIRDRRIAICEDVKLRVVGDEMQVKAANAYITERSGWTYSGKGSEQNRLEELLSEGAGIQEHCDFFTRNCTVCARGGMMLSRARLYNDTKVKDIATESSGIRVGRLDTEKALAGEFDADELDLIEAAFELSAGHITLSDKGEAGREAHKAGVVGAIHFGHLAGPDKYDNAKDRLIAVMDNIIGNDGVFTFDPITRGDERLDAIEYRVWFTWRNALADTCF